jgi:hypothetical protein
MIWIQHTTKFLLVGNYGSQIPGSVTTITQLNTLTQSAPTGIPNSAMLFAEAAQTSTSGFYTYMSASLKGHWHGYSGY